MTIAFTKDPDEVLDFLLDWSARLTGGDTITTSQWIMPTPTTGDIVKDSDTKTASTTTIWLSAGTDGQKYSIVNRVITVGGRTMDQTCVMTIKGR
jgi:hypothetical protein